MGSAICQQDMVSPKIWSYLYLGWLTAHLLALSLTHTPGLVLVVGLGVAFSDL